MRSTSDISKANARRTPSAARPARAAVAAAAVTASLAAALVQGAPSASATARTDAREAPSVACTNLVGDVQALAQAFRTGGDHQLGKDCRYTFTKRAGTTSVLPTVTKDTTIVGNGATIAWTGTEPIRSMFDIADGARLTLTNLTISPGNSGTTPTVRLGPGAVLSLTNSSISIKLTPTGGPLSASPPAAQSAKSGSGAGDGVCSADLPSPAGRALEDRLLDDTALEDMPLGDTTLENLLGDTLLSDVLRDDSTAEDEIDTISVLGALHSPKPVTPPTTPAETTQNGSGNGMVTGTATSTSCVVTTRGRTVTLTATPTGATRTISE
ncbi:hypothetical protein ACFVH6_07070 [Spirillospora sp. NPDC127200]